MVKRTVCCMCLSLILGICYGSGGETVAVCGELLLLSIVAVGILRDHKRVGYASLLRLLPCICLFSIGAAHVQAKEAMRMDLEGLLAKGQEVVVQGKVSRKEKKEQQWIYYLTGTQVRVGNKVYPSYGILVYSSSMQYQPGNILKVTGRYAPFQISRNQGNFNEKQFQQSKKWEFGVRSNREELISAKENRYLVFLRKIRETIKKVFVRSMKEKDAGVMANLVLGDRSLMNQQLKEIYQQAGISHILAVSGLHMSLLGMGALHLLQKLGGSKKASALSAIGVVCSFGLLSGMEVSICRAAGMFVLLMAAQILGYSYDSVSALSVLAMVQLASNPFLIENTGFLLSYSAVLGVTVIPKILKDVQREQESENPKEALKECRKAKEKNPKKALKDCKKTKTENPRQFYWFGEGKELCLDFLQRIRLNIRETMFASICIQLTTLPLTLYVSYEIPCFSVLVNGCILPFFGILLFLGIVGGIFGSLVPFLGTVLLAPAGWILSLNEAICRMFLDLPGAKLITGMPSAELVVFYYGVLAVCLYLVWNSRKKYWFAGVGIACMCLLFVRESPQFEIHMLDVGQGDGSLIQTEEGAAFFVDGGSSNVKQVGKYRILPFLKSKGISSIRGWVVSHADADHISGLEEVLQEGFPVEYLVLAQGMVKDQAMEELVQLAKKAGTKILYVNPGMEFGTKDTVFTVLAPGTAKKRRTKAQTEKETADSDRNAASLVVAVQYQDFTGIFTGDIGREQEQKLLEENILKTYGIENIQFYKAAHHGSNSSNSQEFLEALSPKMTVISCSAKNSYGHPGKEALERIIQTKSKVFCTMEHGQIKVKPEGADIRVWTYLPEIVYDRRKSEAAKLKTSKAAWKTKR